MIRNMYKVLFSILVALGCLPLSAQNDYFLGSSSSSDPFTRHHEAFMNAFMSYVHQQEKANKVSSDEGYIAVGSATCKFKVIDITLKEDQETIVLSFGEGVLVSYFVKHEEEASDDTKIISQQLLITFEDSTSSDIKRENNGFNSYEMLTVIEPSGVTCSFTYECNSSSWSQPI